MGGEALLSSVAPPAPPAPGSALPPAAAGISGGQRKRVTTAEILVGPQSVVLMDEISTGLDRWVLEWSGRDGSREVAGQGVRAWSHACLPPCTFLLPAHRPLFRLLSRSATTYSVCQSFGRSAHALGKTFVISLLQPPPEVVQLFDELLLLTDGRVIFQ